MNDAREYLETRNAMDVVRIAQEEHVLMKKNGFIQFKSGDWCVCVGCFIFASIQMNKHDLCEYELSEFLFWVFSIF